MINLLLWSLLTHTLFRFSQPGAYRVKQGSDYLENQCESRKHTFVMLQIWHSSVKLTRCKICPMFPGQTRCEYTPQTRDQYLIYTDKSLQAFSDSSCRQSCTQVDISNSRFPGVKHSNHYRNGTSTVDLTRISPRPGSLTSTSVSSVATHNKWDTPASTHHIFQYLEIILPKSNLQPISLSLPVGMRSNWRLVPSMRRRTVAVRSVLSTS